MRVGTALRELARFLDECERRGRVSRLGLDERTDADRTGPLTAEVELSLSMAPSGETPLSLVEATVDEGGCLGLGFESDGPVLSTEDHDVDVEPVDATFEPDGTVTVVLAATVRSDDGEDRGADERSGVTVRSPGETTADEPGETDAGEDTADGPARERRDGRREERESDDDEELGAGPEAEEERNRDRDGADESTTGWGDREVPPFRDPELLAEVYESCETFAEMTDELGMDVTAETVRRYMIDHGIHEPSSYDTGAGAAEPDAEPSTDDPATEPSTDEPTAAPGADEESPPVALADGIGLPESLTAESLIEAVERSNTIYEVKREIGVDREDALEMLRELNLLDLVVGRLATEAERDIDREEIVGRLREASATQ